MNEPNKELSVALAGVNDDHCLAKSIEEGFM